MYKEIVKLLRFQQFKYINTYHFLLKLHIFIVDQKSFEQNTITYKLACHFPFFAQGFSILFD